MRRSDLMVATTAGRPPQGLIGYLLDITIRPGYRFASPGGSRRHGEDICTHIAKVSRTAAW
jgi:hypothetical protein